MAQVWVAGANCMGWTKGNIMAENWFVDGTSEFNSLQFVVGTDSSNGTREPLIANESSKALTIRPNWHTMANVDEKTHTRANLYGPGGFFHE
jgi:hypothetical protein